MKQEGGGDLRARVHRVKSRELEALLLVAANSFIDAWYYYCCILWNNFLGNRVSDKSLKLSAWKPVPVWLRKAVVDSHLSPLAVNGGVPGCC